MAYYHYRITKATWSARGGLRNSDLYRKMISGKWTYWAGAKPE